MTCLIVKLPKILFRSKGITNQHKYLHSGEQLGIVKYAQSRLAAEHAIVNHESFKEELRTQLPNTDFPILRLENGLKNMVHIMHNNRADFYLLKNALRTYIQRYDEWPIKDKFIFDAVLMRAFYFLDMPDEAVELFEDQVLSSQFNQTTGYQILLDLLYESEKYDEVIRIYNDLNSTKRLNSSNPNIYIDVIIVATYYKLNTADAFEKASVLWHKMCKLRNFRMFRKSQTFLAALALRQQQPRKALEILKDDTRHVPMCQLTLLAWANTAQFTQVFEMLNGVINRHRKDSKYTPYCSAEVLDEIQQCLDKSGSESEQHEFRSIRKFIESSALFTDKTLDEIICTPFPAFKPLVKKFQFT